MFKIRKFLTLVLLFFLVAGLGSAAWRMNPYTGRLDYYEPASAATLGDLGDVTLTGVAALDILYRNAANTAWVNLSRGADGQYLTTLTNAYTWQTLPVGITTFLGLTDTPSAYTGKGGQFAVVNAGEDAIEFFAGSAAGTTIVADGSGGWSKDENFRIVSGKVSAGGYEGTAIANTYIAGINQNLLTSSSPTLNDLTISTPSSIYSLSHNSFADYDANQHTDHTAVSILSAGLISGGGTIDGNQTLTLTEATIESAIDTLGAVQFTGDVEFLEDIFVTWADAADHMFIDQGSESGTEDQALIRISDSREGASVDEQSEATFRIESEGWGIVNIGKTYLEGFFAVNNIFEYDRTTDHNLSVGYLAGQDLATGGQYNTLVGEQAGTDQTTGDDNVIIGYQAGFVGTTNDTGTFVGYQAGYNLQNTNNNVAIGWKAMWGIAPTGYGGNTAVGTEAFYSAGEESLRNTVIGYRALYTASDEAENITAIGYMAGYNLTSPSSNNVLVGSYAGSGGVSPNYQYNVVIGVDSAGALTSGSWNTIVGNSNAQALTTGAYNVVVGNDASENNVIGGYNVVVGASAGKGVATNSYDYNTIVGYEAGFGLTTGDYNILIGYQAGYKLTTNVSNILIGKQIASVSTSQAHSNVIIGDVAAIELTNGYENVILGKEAARDIKSAGLNVIIGWQASLEHESGNYNTIVGTQAGYGLANSSNYGYNTFIGMQAGYATLTAGVRNVVLGYEAAQDLTTGTDNIVIGYMAGEGWLDTESEKLVIDVTDTATPLIYGDFSADNITFNGDFTVEMDAALDRIYFHQGSESGTENQPLIFIDDAREGATVDEWSEASLYIAGEGWGLAVIGKTYFEGDLEMVEDLNLTWTSAADKAVISQSNVTGTDATPLIFINDDRTGEYADTKEEATIRIDAEGTYALYIEDGQLYVNDIIDIQGATYLRDSVHITANMRLDMGYFDSYLTFDTNGTGDSLTTWFMTQTATESTALFFSALDPNNMTDHDNYLSPTIIITNDEAADANDYAGVVVGERTQASVLVNHYFDFYAMTGATDGTPDVNATELAAIFRFGASGSATPGYSTTPGDVLFEGAVEIDGDVQHAGYNRHDMVVWIDCFDHGSTVAKYAQDWDVASLNTQGAGDNDIDTNPSHITLTTDSNGVGDNEGTRTDLAIVTRVRLPRMEFSVALGQTANTQFYGGWNDDGLNAMVAAADKYVIVFFDVSDNANWQIKVGDGSTEDVFTSSVTGDTNQVLHEIWAEANGTIHWRVNGTELDITGSVDNVMQADDHYLIVGQAQSVTGAAAIVAEICFVEFEKTKAN